MKNILNQSSIAPGYTCTLDIDRCITKTLKKIIFIKNEKNNFLCLLKLDSLIKKFTAIYNTACDKLIMHWAYKAIILQHHQIQSSKGAREENGCSFAVIL